MNQTSSLVPAVDNMQTLQTKWKKSKKVSISGGHIFLSTLVNSFCQMTENFGFPEYTHSWSPLSAYFFHYYSFFEVGARVVKIYEISISLCFLYHYPPTKGLTGSSCLMGISLLQIKLMQFFKTFQKYLANAFFAKKWH